MDDLYRFVFGTRKIIGKRLTYAGLNGKTENVGGIVWLEGLPDETAPQGKARQPLSAARFKALPEYDNFRHGMRQLLTVPKMDLEGGTCQRDITEGGELQGSRKKTKKA